jgi:hypothetical protein
MTLIQEIDYGTPASKAEKTVRLTSTATPSKYLKALR